MSTTAVAADSNQLNFNPSWMRPVSMPISGGGGNGGGNRMELASATESHPVDYPVADPVFVKNRYGREDLLALQTKDAHPPDGLEKCQFYVAGAQKPIVLVPLSDTETRLQHNINSSKAMSLLSHADRATIASGGMIGGPNIPVQLRAGQENRSFSPSWMPTSGGGTGIGRGSTQFGRGGAGSGGGGGGGTFGSSYRGRGITTANSTNSTDAAAIGNRYGASRGGRGGVTNVLRSNASTQPFNARAQGLYDPRDPRDRPRQRLRSTSDDTNPPFGGVVEDSSAASFNSGWTQVGRAAAPWSKRTHANSGGSTQSQGNADVTNQPQLPEWMSDDHEKGESSNLEETGTFDDSGQFRTSATAQRMTPLDLIQSAASNIPVDVSERQRPNPEEEKPTRTPTAAVAVPNAWSALSESLEPQPNKITNQFVEKPDTSLTLTPDQAVPAVATTAVASIPFQPKYTTGDVSSLRHSLSQPSSIGLTSRADYVNEWYYVDPRSAVQGPFITNCMQAWYKLGYFTSELRVRNGTESNFVTLGELITINGEETPFESKALPSPVMQLPLQQTQEVRNIWSRDYSASLIEAAKVKEERQKLEEEQRRMAEQERQLKEMREALLKEEEERLARERKILEKELQLQRAQEELARLAAEEKERAAAREREIEAERKRLAEEMERAKKDEVERALAETRKKEEEREQQRLKAEAERRMKEARELKRKQEEAEEAARKAAAEQERLRQQAVAREKEDAHHKLVESKKESASKEFVITEEFMPALRQRGAQDPSLNRPFSWQTTYRSVDEKIISPKAAPWVSARDKGAIDRSEPSLLDIQQEEERQMLAEMKQRQQMNGASWKDASEAARAGVWGNASQKLTWRQNSQPTTETVTVPSRQAAWGGAGAVGEKISAANPLWDGPSLESGNRAKANRSSHDANKSERSPKSNNANTEHEAMKKLFKQSVTNSANELTSWMINRVKQLNPQVEADVFAAFIEGVDNPNEVEDYIIGYLGESRSVKELIREFLERRSQARQKKGPVDKDDLTHFAQAADAASATATNSKSDNTTSQQLVTGGGGGGGGSAGGGAGGGGGRKKKKGNKGNRLIVDGACLGFKGTADPNRVNIGEIDTIGAITDYSRK